MVKFFLQPYNKYIFVLSLNLVVLNLFYFLMTQACIKTLLWIDFCHRPALRYVYMLEFHPSLGLASRVYEALQSALKVCIFSLFCNLHEVFLGGFFLSARLCLKNRKKKLNSPAHASVNCTRKQVIKNLWIVNIMEVWLKKGKETKSPR